MSSESHARAPSSARRGLLPALAVLAVAAGIVVSGLAMRWSRADELQDRAQAQAVRAVTLVSPAPIGETALELPGRIEPWARAPIHARVSGYLTRWTADIGQPVRAGDLLAEIETPDLDQSLRQARAELERARGEAALAATSARRWESLLASDSVSRQEVEERVATHAARQAAVTALEAHVQRARSLQAFRRVVAPFDGIVTARNTDVGALVDADAAPGAELFVVSDVRRLRVYVNVPQRQTAAIRIGTKAEVRVPERPGTGVEATVQSMSQAIDARSGAMRVQLVVENPDRDLLAGGFAAVRFATPASGDPALGLPPSALIMGRAGVRVATVDDDGDVALRSVTIARDLGHVVELVGLAADDRVIDSPPDGLSAGDRVRVVAPGSRSAS